MFSFDLSDNSRIVTPLKSLRKKLSEKSNSNDKYGLYLYEEAQVMIN